MWKILTAQISEEIYHSLVSRGMCAEEQKGSLKGSKGTGDRLYTDYHIVKESKMKGKHVAMVRINYKEAYNIAR